MKSVVLAASLTACLMAVGAPAHAATDPTLVSGLKKALHQSALGNDVSVSVVDAATGVQLFGHDAREPQLPASTMKVLTATTSLQTLGRNHRFATTVVRGPKPREIVLVGGGDPMLGAGDLRVLATRTAKKLPRLGLKGTVKVGFDDYLFPRPTDAQGWAPGDMPAYAAAVRPLSMLGDYSTQPSEKAASIFVSALREQGVSVADVGRESADFNAPAVASIGHPLSSAIKLLLTVSENNIAEVLFRQVAIATGRQASWIGSGEAARGVLEDMGIPTTGLRLHDGSGLSNADRVPASTLTAVLSHAVNGDDSALRPLIGWLPIAGQTGTLTNRFASPPSSCARGAVFAKTGSITGVNTLAGVTRAPDGSWRAFAVMVNHRPDWYPNSSTSLAVDTVAATVHGCT